MKVFKVGNVQGQLGFLNRTLRILENSSLFLIGQCKFQSWPPKSLFFLVELPNFLAKVAKPQCSLFGLLFLSFSCHDYMMINSSEFRILPARLARTQLLGICFLE